MSSTPLNFALGYARRDFRVFPLHHVCRDNSCSCGREHCSSAGKHPRTKNGVKDATTDSEQIKSWWATWPVANVGIATGNGLYVIDVDCAKGASLDSLRDCGLDDLLCSLVVRTGSGGYHIYLNYDPALMPPNTINRLGLFIDTRGEGGYVVAPPSRNKDGIYVVEAKNPIEALPPALLAKLQGPGVPHSSLSTSLSSGKQSLKGHTLDVSNDTPLPQSRQNTPLDPLAHGPATAAHADAPAVPGMVKEARNESLIHLAGQLSSLGMAAPEIRALVVAYNQEHYGHGRHAQGPLSDEELQRTIFRTIEKWAPRLSTEPCASGIISLTELMARPLPEPVWIVPELLSTGLTLLAGKPKTGKSWLILLVALCVASGHSTLGKEACVPRRVLYLSLEDSAVRFQHRVKVLLDGREVPALFDLHIKWEPLVKGGLLNLRTWLETHPDTRMVIIDTLAKVRTAARNNGNVYQEDYELMSQLQDLASEYQIALAVVHHTRKQESSDPFDEISGSTGLTGAADTCMVFKRERHSREATLNITGRDVEEQELALTFTPGNGGWTPAGTAAERQISQSRQEILDLLQEHESMTPAEMAKELEKPQGVLRKTLSRMFKEGLIEKSGHGRYMLPSTRPVPVEHSADQAAD